ncbi:MAG: flagellar basal body P-ring formation chaperone FlgA [Ignavibacteria bacterium]|jgi:flagella basal body P-ring formation protein FlgA
MMNLLNILCFLFVGLNGTSVIDEYLQKNLKGFNSYEYEIVTDVKSEFKIDETREFGLRNGYMYIPVELLVSQDYSKKSSITLKVKLFKNVLVAGKDLHASEEISPNDFILELRDIPDTRLKVVSTFSYIENKKARRNIDKGDVLTKGMLTDIPLIDRGDIVNAFFEYGTVIVSFRVSSRGVGSKGDRIRVERDDKRVFIAEVVNKNNVKIIE